MNDRPSGILSPNSRKTKPNHPDFNGSITIDRTLLAYLNSRAAQGKELKLDISGWKKEGRYGAFVSLSPKEAWEKPADSAPRPASPGWGNRDDDSEIPF